jgi:YD repeat-containing protein
VGGDRVQYSAARIVKREHFGGLQRLERLGLDGTQITSKGIEVISTLPDLILISLDPLGNRSTQIYDNADRLIAIVNPLGKRVTTRYDAGGRAIARIDQLANP